MFTLNFISDPDKDINYYSLSKAKSSYFHKQDDSYFCNEKKDFWHITYPFYKHI